MNELQPRINLKQNLDEIDNEVKDEVFDSFYESRLRILIGMWEKGKILVEYRGVNSTISFRQIADETGRDRIYLKKWHDLYNEFKNRQKFISEYAEPAARRWTERIFLLKGPKEIEWLRVYDIWNFQGRDEEFGIKYPGNIPGSLILNILYYFSEERDLIIDPMAGGGVVIDCCKFLNRRCFAFDIVPSRNDISKNDILLGFPSNIMNSDLIIIDPPYYKKKEAEYGGKSISSFNKEKYLESFYPIAKNCLNIIKKNKFLAFIMEPYIDYENSQNSIWIFEYLLIFKEVGWKVERIIDIPESSQRYAAYDITRAKENKQLLTLQRQLIIFRS